MKDGNRPGKSKNDTKGDNDDDDDDHNDGSDYDNNEKGYDDIVGAAAVVIHERPVVLQAPVIGRPFVKEVPHFLKAVVVQQSNRSCSDRASQLQRLEETVKPITDQSFHPTKAAPIRRVITADQKSGTLQLGELMMTCSPILYMRMCGLLH
jgi:hypothetical protein